MKDTPGIGNGPIIMPETTVTARPAAPTTPGGGITVESTMIVANDGGRNVDITLNDGNTYNVALSRDGNSVTVTTGNPAHEVTGAALDSIAPQLREALEGFE